MFLSVTSAIRHLARSLYHHRIIAKYTIDGVVNTGGTMKTTTEEAQDVYIGNRRNLTRYKIIDHKDKSNNKRKSPDDDAQKPYQPSIKQLPNPVDDVNETEFPSDCSLQRRDATTMNKQS